MAVDQGTENTEFEDNDNFLTGTSGVATLGKLAGMSFGIYMIYLVVHQLDAIIESFLGTMFNYQEPGLGMQVH
ncbi:hypothetical protein [Leptospira mayottensis]|uniref:hypothetical protein n=1 Tax=Leptospira mayottensis TaxID=1137606 RepID=UPI0020B108F2|nr:hypothetical protein [Leptospira mayottensis]